MMMGGLSSSIRKLCNLRTWEKIHMNGEHAEYNHPDVLSSLLRKPGRKN